MKAKTGKNIGRSESNPGDATNTSPRDGSPFVSVFLCLWFALVAIAFWGPYFGIAVSVAFYCAALLIVVAVGILGYLRRAEEARRNVR